MGDVHMSETMVRPVNLEGFSHLYTVDEYGNIFSLRKQRYLKPAFNQYDYAMVLLSSDKNRPDLPNKWRMVHRIVAITFIGAPPTAKHEINHIDHNPSNNHYSNLEWLTHSENIQKSYTEGGMESSKCGRRAGYEVSREVKAKMASAKLKPVLVTKDGIEYRFGSVEYLCLNSDLGFRMYRKKFNRIIKEGGVYKGWSLKFIEKDNRIEAKRDPVLFGCRLEDSLGEVNRYAMESLIVE